MFTYTVFASGDLVYVTEDFTLTHITVKEFNKKAVSFKNFIEALTKHCLGDKK